MQVANTGRCWSGEDAGWEASIVLANSSLLDPPESDEDDREKWFTHHTLQTVHGIKIEGCHNRVERMNHHQLNAVKKEILDEKGIEPLSLLLSRSRG